MAKAAAESTASANPWNLRDPVLAAFLAWLIPGAGHWYQRRYSKAGLYSTCILLIYAYGLIVLGEGRVVYASMKPQDRRWSYLCQVGTGLPALPALVQTNRVRSGKAPLWNGFMAPPGIGVNRNPGEIDDMHYRLGRRFELGTVYTMIAGLLNMLVIYDALIGPAYATPPGARDGPRRKESPAPGEKALAAR